MNYFQVYIDSHYYMYDCSHDKHTYLSVVLVELRLKVPYSKNLGGIIIWWVFTQNRFGGKNFSRLNIYAEGNQVKTEKMADKTMEINDQSPGFLPPKFLLRI